MSRRGAGSASKTERRPQAPEAEGESRFDFSPAPELARRVVRLARELLGEGLDAGEVCSLFTDAAQILSKQPRGLSREDWLTLCAELYERDQRDCVGAPRLTAPGGSA